MLAPFVTIILVQAFPVFQENREITVAIMQNIVFLAIVCICYLLIIFVFTSILFYKSNYFFIPMKFYFRLILLITSFVSLCTYVCAQIRQDREKQRLDYIEKETDRLTSMLSLEDWQVFYVDSILSYNTAQMEFELEMLREQKVSNANLYIDIRDKWGQNTYNAYKKFFSKEQWKKYLKTGALKEQKEREKRRNEAEKSK